MRFHQELLLLRAQRAENNSTLEDFQPMPQSTRMARRYAERLAREVLCGRKKRPKCHVVRPKRLKGLLRSKR